MHGSWEGKKTLAAAFVFLLDFPLYRTYQEFKYVVKKRLVYWSDTMAGTRAKCTVSK
jgi:hypothetical protein